MSNLVKREIEPPAISYDEAYYIVLRNRTLVTIDSEQAQRLMQDLVQLQTHHFVQILKRTVNTADIVEVVQCEIYDREHNIE